MIDPTAVEGLVAANRARPSALDAVTPASWTYSGDGGGRSNASIAERLVLSERAVEKHSYSIFAKLGLNEERDRNRRVSAVLVYVQNQ